MCDLGNCLSHWLRSRTVRDTTWHLQAWWSFLSFQPWVLLSRRACHWIDSVAGLYWPRALLLDHPSISDRIVRHVLLAQDPPGFSIGRVINGTRNGCAVSTSHIFQLMMTSLTSQMAKRFPYRFLIHQAPGVPCSCFRREGTRCVRALVIPSGDLDMLWYLWP